ncbi:hypothetical protein GCM10023063_03100 [Arthrobacter methylotrophus]|uniref:hypothetical protein n=1 Tax=Arthrobacter methylotrophus TaxID=121291 RepID=UPI0031EA4A0F
MSLFCGQKSSLGVEAVELQNALHGRENTAFGVVAEAVLCSERDIWPATAGMGVCPSQIIRFDGSERTPLTSPTVGWQSASDKHKDVREPRTADLLDKRRLIVDAQKTSDV